MNEVQDGHFDEMFLSIEYLEKKYGRMDTDAGINSVHNEG